MKHHLISLILFSISSWRRAAGLQMNTAATSTWAGPYGANILGHWDIVFELKGCKNIQIGIFGPIKVNYKGYYIDLNKLESGKYFSAVRKTTCSSCNHVLLKKVDQGGSYFTCGASTFHKYWVSWDGCTIRMGKGDVVKQQEVISVYDPYIIEIKYMSLGASDKATVASAKFPSLTENPTTVTLQTCDNNCPEKNRPPLSTSVLPFIFRLTLTGKTITSPGDIIEEISGLTRKECQCRCLCDATCYQYSFSTSGDCKLSNKCAPAIGDDSTSSVYSVYSWNT